MQVKYKENSKRIANAQWKFSNCCLVETAYGSKSKPDAIFAGVKQAFPGDDFDNLTAISPYLSTKNWMIQFKNANSFEAAIGKVVCIDSHSVKLVDVNQFLKKTSSPSQTESQFIMTVFLRIHWLPAECNMA